MDQSRGESSSNRPEVNDEAWLPKRVYARAMVRLALLKKLEADGEMTFSQYQKFQADFQIGPVEQPFQAKTAILII